MRSRRTSGVEGPGNACPCKRSNCANLGRGGLEAPAFAVIRLERCAFRAGRPTLLRAVVWPAADSDRSSCSGLSRWWVWRARLVWRVGSAFKFLDCSAYMRTDSARSAGGRHAESTRDLLITESADNNFKHPNLAQRQAQSAESLAPCLQSHPRLDPAIRSALRLTPTV
jgi:hypothetical protein